MNYLKIVSEIKNAKEIYEKLNPKFSFKLKDGKVIITISVDRNYQDISEDVRILLENIKPIELGNIVVILQLKDKVLLLEDKQLKEQAQ